jgi:acetolactate synthase-1/2/3 large subunit
MSRMGAQCLVDQLRIQGVDTVFCVPGESYLPVLDALVDHRDTIRLIVNRHESGTGFMAEAYGKLTGRPGVAFVTRGPGATNASIAVHTAHQDSTPLILFIGQVGSDMFEREAFQEVDYRFMFARLCKWVAQIDRADRIPEFVARAFAVAQSGRSGPVVLALPEDMLSSLVDVADAGQARTVQASPSSADLAQVQQLLSKASAPLVIVGGPGWNATACRDLRRFVETWQLPVSCAFRFQDTFDNHHPLYAGDVGIGINPTLAQRVRDADVLLVLGPRLGEMTTSGYSLLQVPQPRQTLIHVHADADELGRVYQAALPICSGMPQIAAALAGLPSPERLTWAIEPPVARVAYDAWQAEPVATREADFNLWQLMHKLRNRMPENTLIANGAGNFATWGHRFWRYGGIEQHGRTQLAPTSGAMGYGMPAGIAAALLKPGQPVLILAGDGDFLMTGQELATAVQYGAKPLILVFNNRQYGTIRMHQEREFPGRQSGTALRNPDFAALARAFGAFGVQVSALPEFDTALEAAMTHLASHQTPALIELLTDPRLIAPGLRLSA